MGKLKKEWEIKGSISEEKWQGQITQQSPFLFSYCDIIVPLFLPQETILVDIISLYVFFLFICSFTKPWEYHR